MVDKIFPAEFARLILKHISIGNLYEIRVRLNQAIVFNVKNELVFLSSAGITKNINDGIVASRELIAKIIYIACENSVYAVNNQLREGFITVKNGIRIGVAGEVVYENDNVMTLKNITYLNIRLPHKVDNCSARIFHYLIDKPFKNTLIISSPGLGKTTILRDIIYQIYKNNYALNSLILDERYEIAGSCEGQAQFNLGAFTDIISGCKKQFGFEMGIRSMNPDVIFTDEIATFDDIKAIDYAMASGVSVVATTHSRNLNELLKKPNFTELLTNKTFKRFIVLSKNKGIGTIDGLYDENYKLLYRD
ncbi:MAG: stage III sporulation protein AA [Clostridia bacterium]|nr:stage III sporulation protein AA [Clostridia bacterium]